MAAPPASDILTNIPVTKMTIDNLELELELLRTSIRIFDDAMHGINSPQAFMTGVLKIYRERMREIENEIFERGVLV
jgi:hypothetical protein